MGHFDETLALYTFEAYRCLVLLYPHGVHQDMICITKPGDFGCDLLP